MTDLVQNILVYGLFGLSVLFIVRQFIPKRQKVKGALTNSGKACHGSDCNC